MIGPVLEFRDRRLPEGSLRRRMATGAFWSMGGATLGQASTLFSSIIVSRLLGKEAYGELGIILSTINMFSTFAAMGLGLTANKHIAQYRNSDPARAGRIIGLTSLVANFSGATVAVALFMLAPFLCRHAINAPHLVWELRIGAASLFMAALNGAQAGALSGFEAFKTLAQLRLIAALVYFPVVIAGVYFGGLMGVVTAQAGYSTCNWLFHHLALRRQVKKAKIRVRRRDFRSELGLLWNFSAPSLLSTYTFMAAMWTVNALLVNQPGGFGEMGLYRAANQWNTALMFIPGIVGQTFLPMLSNVVGEGNWRSAGKIIMAGLGINLISVLLPGLALAALSPWIMSLYGEDFRPGWPVMIGCMAAAALSSVASPIDKVIVASGKMWMSFVLNGIWALILILAATMLLSSGARGVAAAYVISYIIRDILVIGYVYFAIWKKKPKIAGPVPAPEPGPSFQAWD